MPVDSGGGVNSVGVRGGRTIFSARRDFHHPHPQAFRTLELNVRHLRFHGKIGDCEQSKWQGIQRVEAPGYGPRSELGTRERGR